MSESEKQTEEKKKSPLGIVWIIFVLLIAVLGIGIVNNVNNNEKDDTTKTAIDIVKTSIVEEKSEPVETIANEIAVKEQSEAFNLEKAATPRILGNSDAPVKISEHSSFTCGACAAFHSGNFKQIKKDYVDTGKAYIVFNDFPRNAFDIKIGAVARCVPEKAFFNFVQLLFETQKNWLNEGYLEHVKQNAKLTGASDSQIETCLNSGDLHKALAEGREKAMKDHDVKATPTLVINDHVVVMGLDPYSKIKAVLDAEMDKVVE